MRKNIQQTLNSYGREKSKRTVLTPFIIALLLCLITPVDYGIAIAQSEEYIRSDGKRFDQWLQEFGQRASDYGISSDTVALVRDEAKFLTRTLKRDRNQVESRLTLKRYLTNIVSPSRLRNGSQKWKENQELLNSVYQQYPVEARFLMAFWGIESGYGRSTGSYPIISTLATMAYDQRRSAFFEKQLLNVMTIIDEKMIDYEGITGGWAGEIGQIQFLPSSYLAYAVDFDQDGKRDLWKNLPDIFASAANYLIKNGWNKDIVGWGGKVSASSASKKALWQEAKKKTKRPVSQWKNYGITLPSKFTSDAKTMQIAARVVMPEGEDGDIFLAFPNFDTILRWNRSQFYAIAVGMLADEFTPPR